MGNKTLHKHMNELLKRTQTLHQTMMKNTQDYHKQLTTVLREILAQALEDAKDKIMKRVKNERAKTTYQVWISTKRKISHSIYIPITMPGHNIESIYLFTEWREERPTNTTNDRYMLPEEFSKKVKKLRKSILRGEYDQHLKAEPNRIIHEFIMPKPQT